MADTRKQHTDRQPPVEPPVLSEVRNIPAAQRVNEQGQVHQEGPKVTDPPQPDTPPFPADVVMDRTPPGAK